MRAAGSAVAGPTAAGAAAGRIVAAALVAAAAVDDALRVRQLVPQAALQAAAQARQLRRIETEVLLLRHLDRDRLEGLKKRGAAERTAAGAVAADYLGFVADAALAHLQGRDAKGFGLAVLMLEPRHDIVARRETDDTQRRVLRRSALVVELG